MLLFFQYSAYQKLHLVPQVYHELWYFAWGYKMLFVPSWLTTSSVSHCLLIFLTNTSARTVINIVVGKYLNIELAANILKVVIIAWNVASKVMNVCINCVYDEHKGRVF